MAVLRPYQANVSYLLFRFWVRDAPKKGNLSQGAPIRPLHLHRSFFGLLVYEQSILHRHIDINPCTYHGRLDPYRVVVACSSYF
jgi:hypothetical protein